jgi:hypothetical protein
LIGHFSHIVPPFADRGLSRNLTWSAPEDERGKLKSGVSTISLGRLQYIRWVTAGPTQKTKTNIAQSCVSLRGKVPAFGSSPLPIGRSLLPVILSYNVLLRRQPSDPHTEVLGANASLCLPYGTETFT